MEAFRFYIQKDLQKAADKYQKRGAMQLGTLLNELLRQHLSKEGFI